MVEVLRFDALVFRTFWVYFLLFCYWPSFSYKPCLAAMQAKASLQEHLL